MRKPSLTLPAGSNILAAWAEKCNGPGWSNRPVWVLYAIGGRTEVACIQPEDQTHEMRVLFEVAATVTKELTAWVRAATKIEEDAG